VVSLCPGTRRGETQETDRKPFPFVFPALSYFQGKIQGVQWRGHTKHGNASYGRIGENSVVAAGSAVTKDLPPIPLSEEIRRGLFIRLATAKEHSPRVVSGNLNRDTTDRSCPGAGHRAGPWNFADRITAWANGCFRAGSAGADIQNPRRIERRPVQAISPPATDGS
jgi:hypothetical protein